MSDSSEKRSTSFRHYTIRCTLTPRVRVRVRVKLFGDKLCYVSIDA